MFHRDGIVYTTLSVVIQSAHLHVVVIWLFFLFRSLLRTQRDDVHQVDILNCLYSVGTEPRKYLLCRVKLVHSIFTVNLSAHLSGRAV